MVAMQTLIVALVVAASTCYATWKLMPAAARRWLAAWVLRVSPGKPGLITSALRRAASASAGCGCDGCEHAKPPAGAARTDIKPVQFHPRQRR